MTNVWNNTRGIKARRLHDTQNITDAEFREIRKNTIGGSDIASIAGLNPWATNVDVYLQKTGQAEVSENEKMKWGKHLEPVVANEYGSNNSDTLRIENVFSVLQSVDLAFATANLDRLSILKSPTGKFENVQGNGVLEVKTTSWSQAWDNDEIPDYYYCQLQWYLGVTGLKWGQFAVLINGNDYRESGIVYADNDVFQNLLDIADRFYNFHLKKRVPPIPNGKPQIADAHKLLHPEMDNTTVRLDTSIDELISKRAKINAYQKQLSGQIAEINANILHRLGAHKYGETDNWKITTVAKNQSYFKQSNFKKSHPDLFSQFSESKEIRYPIFKKKG
jgi:putative phage-type endonuclease